MVPDPQFYIFYQKGGVDKVKTKRKGVVREGCSREEKKKKRRGEVTLSSSFLMLGPTDLL